MPIYEYLCEECGRITEVMQKLSDPAPRKCLECGSRRIAKLVSRTAFQLKGGGWYSDLYSSTKKDTGATRSEAGTGGKAEAGKTATPGASAPAKTTGAKPDS